MAENKTIHLPGKGTLLQRRLALRKGKPKAKKEK